MDRKGFKVVGWPDRCDPRAGAKPAEPTSSRFGKINGHAFDAVVWRGDQKPPDLDAVWHPAGVWLALRPSAQVAG